jgi:hypothetical protein
MRIKILITICFFLTFSLFFGKVMFISGDNVNLREEGNKNSKVIKKLSKNTEIEVVEINDKWAKVKVDQTYGYVSSEYIIDSPLVTNDMDLEPNGFKSGYIKGASYISHPLSILGLFAFIGLYKSLFKDKKDLRYSKGVKEGSLNLFEVIFCFIIYVSLFLVFGFFSGVFYMIKSFF